MKKAVVASFLATASAVAVLASGAPMAIAQTAAPAAAQQGAANGQVQMSQAEYTAYNSAIAQSGRRKPRRRRLRHISPLTHNPRSRPTCSSSS